MGWPQLWNEPWPVGSLVLQPKGEWWREGRLSLMSGNGWYSLSTNATGMSILTSQSQFKYVLGAKSCLTLFFICTQPKHGLASCLDWQKWKSSSLPKKPVSILCKSHKMLRSIVEAVICMYAGVRVWLSLHWDPGFAGSCALWLWLCYARKRAVFSSHVMVVQSNRYKDRENNLCRGWGQSRFVQCPISHPCWLEHPFPLMPVVAPSRDGPSQWFPIHPSDPHRCCLIHVVSDALAHGTYVMEPSALLIWYRQTHFSEMLIIQVKCFCNLLGHQEKAFLFICHHWQKINKTLSVGIKHDAVPALVSRVTPHPLPHMPRPHVRKIARVRFDLFCSLPILSSFGPNFTFHSTCPDLQQLYQSFLLLEEMTGHIILPLDTPGACA